MYDLVPTLSLLHLDADHSYKATKEAFNLYAPKVKYGGHVVFHDAWPHEGYLPYPGVTRFVVELFDDKNWQLERCVDRSACFLKD